MVGQHYGPLLMQSFQNTWHSFLGCTLVILTLNAFVLTLEKHFWGELMFCQETCDKRCVFNHIGTACSSGTPQTTGVMSQQLSQADDCERLCVV